MLILCAIFMYNHRLIKTGSGQTEEKIVKDRSLAGCPRLAHLDLSGCRHVDNGVLATIGTLPGLRKLAICGCREFDDAGVKQVRKKRSLFYFSIPTRYSSYYKCHIYNYIFSPTFNAKNDHFTKKGSGQT